MATRLLPRLGARSLMLLGLGLTAAGLLLFSRLGVDSSFLAGILPAEMIAGVGGRDAGVASALNNATQQVGGSLGIALLNTVASSAAASYLAAHARGLAGAAVLRLVPAASVHGYVSGFEVSAAMVAAAFVLTAVLLGPATEADRAPVVGLELEGAAEAA